MIEHGTLDRYLDRAEAADYLSSRGLRTSRNTLDRKSTRLNSSH